MAIHNKMYLTTLSSQSSNKHDKNVIIVTKLYALYLQILAACRVFSSVGGLTEWRSQIGLIYGLMK